MWEGGFSGAGRLDASVAAVVGKLLQPAFGDAVQPFNHADNNKQRPCQ